MFENELTRVEIVTSSVGGDATYRHTTAFNPRQRLGFIMKRWFSPMNLSAINANLSFGDLELEVQYFSFVSV